MEKLLNIKRDLEKLLRQTDSEPGTIEVLYCQKSIQEAIFWIGKQIANLIEEE